MITLTELSNTRNLQILDTTIRDGSYSVNFEYSREHIKTIVLGLLDAGIKWIEIGHGMSAGLGKAFPTATVDDIDCYKIVRALVGDKAKIGAIIAPAIIAADPIKAMINLLDFIRVVATPESINRAANYIESAKSYGKPIFVQLVKSHLFKGPRFKKIISPLLNAGTDVIYVVDTCGTLIPQEIIEMINDIKSICSLPIGFHGHNNSALAISNSLSAILAGASFIDATIGGIGRGAGNTQLEILISLLQRSGALSDCSLHKVLELNEYLQTEFPNILPGINPREVAFAHYGLDSTKESKINAICKKHNLNIYEFLKTLQKHVNQDWIKDEDIEKTRDVCLAKSTAL